MSKTAMFQVRGWDGLYTQQQLESVGWTRYLIRHHCTLVEVEVPPVAAPTPVIDWSKAPEGATHGRVTTAGFDFYRRLGGQWVYFSKNGAWERAYHTSESDCEIRPIRTPEQIAAEERDRFMSELYQVVRTCDCKLSWVQAMGAIYDAGYRKQVAP